MEWIRLLLFGCSLSHRRLYLPQCVGLKVLDRALFDLLKYALTMESAISTIPRPTYLRTVHTLNSIKSKIIV